MLADAGCYFLTDGHGISTLVPPALAAMLLFFTETGVAALVEIRILTGGLLKWVILVRRNIEFYKDLGWEAEYEYIKPYIMPNGQRKNTGIKYHKITGRGLGLGDKATVPYWARNN